MIFALKPLTVGCVDISSVADESRLTPPLGLLVLEDPTALPLPPLAPQAWGAAASASTARIGSVSFAGRKFSLSSAGGVSCRAGAERDRASRGFTARFAPGTMGPPLRGFR